MKPSRKHTHTLCPCLPFGLFHSPPGCGWHHNVQHATRGCHQNSLSFFFYVTTLASQQTQQETTSLNLETGQLPKKLRRNGEKGTTGKSRTSNVSAFFFFCCCCLSLCTAFYRRVTVCFSLLNALLKLHKSAVLADGGLHLFSRQVDSVLELDWIRRNAESRKCREIRNEKRVQRWLPEHMSTGFTA